ncbi:MAG: hypothetical protein NT154_23615, partial [Verrucomicrobia bacterium]|nr:hypothetical protein [Verrucomicrobiota bacterium]
MKNYSLNGLAAVITAWQVLLGGTLHSSAAADVRLPKIFTDNMMLQRDQPVRVWGWADAGEAVTVTLAGNTAATNADKNGQWSIELPAIKAGENLELTVRGKNSLTLKNVLIGDIWVCSGQSNMEMGLNGCLGFEDDLRAADLPKIRRIKFNLVQSGQPELDAPTATPWQICTPETAAGFTAVGFYFARELHQKTGVPIGIVDDNWGGTAIEPWVPTEGLALVEELKPQWVAKQDAIKDYRAQLPKSLTELEAWIARTRADLASGAPTAPAPLVPAIPDGGWSGIYNAMIHPIVRFPIKGALWYQGESNGGEGETYYDKMRALIGGWRRQWGQGDFPFYYVQLANLRLQPVMSTPFMDRGTFVRGDMAGAAGRQVWATCRHNDSLFVVNVHRSRKMYVTSGVDRKPPAGWDGRIRYVSLREINADGKLEAVVVVWSGADGGGRGVYVLGWESGKLLWTYMI